MAALGVLTFALILGAIVVGAGTSSAASLSITAEEPSTFTRWFRGIIGALLVVFGIWQLTGGTLKARWMNALAGRGQAEGARGRPRLGLSLYGFGYVAAGLGCAAPISAGLVAFALGTGGGSAALGAFAVYALTLGALMSFVSVQLGAGPYGARALHRLQLEQGQALRGDRARAGGWLHRLLSPACRRVQGVVPVTVGGAPRA